MKEKCPNQYAACQKDSKCPGVLQKCQNKCGTKESCWQLCLAQENDKPAIDLAKCAAANDCQKAVEEEEALSDPIPCIQEKCPTQYANCVKDPKCIPALQDCNKKCGSSQSCWEFCLPGKGSQAAIDTAKCAHAQGCDKVTDLATPQDCIEKFCKNEEQACENDRKCIITLNFCDSRCNTTLSCWKECLDKAKDINATKYFNCVVDHDCMDKVESKVITHKRKHHEKHGHKRTDLVTINDPETCMKEKCPNQYAACQKDSKCPGVLQKCQNKCGTKESCWQLCLAQENDKPAIDLAKCAAANDCQKAVEEEEALSDPIPCIQEKCPTQYANCVKDPKCIPALQDCNKKCGSSQSCWEFCLPGKGSQAAIDTAKCAHAQGCDKVSGEDKVETALAPVSVADPETCMKEKCPNQYAACQKDSKCPGVLQKCQNKCGTKESCWQLCLAQENDKPAIDLAKCAAANDCQKAVEEEEEVVALSDPIPCIQEKCPTQYANCVKDPKCVPALQDCNKKCGSSQSCWEFCLPGKGSQAAIDTAKCAHAQGCDKVTLQSHPFMQCMNKSCVTSQLECLYDKHCSKYLHKCSKSLFNYDLECLSEKSKDSSILGGWFQCAGEHFCL